MKKLYTAMSTRRIEEAVEELYAGLNVDGSIYTGSIKLIIFFVSSMYDVKSVHRLMNARFNNIQLVGCTTSGELYSGYLGSGSIVAMGFTSSIVSDMHLEVIEDLHLGLPDFAPIIHRFSDYFGESVSSMSHKEYFSLMLVDGLCKKEEQFLESFSDFTNIGFTGGSSGDDAKFQQTILFANGQYYEHSGLILIIKSACPFGIERSHNFVSTNKILKVTKADEVNRIIHELDGKPAALAYCDALGIKLENAPQNLIINPLGLILDLNQDPFIRSVAKILPDNSLAMFCAVKEEMNLEILKNIDMVDTTRSFINTLRTKHSTISGILAFNCILRYVEMQLSGRESEYGALFKDIPTVGFCTYGEYYIGFINQTLTILVFE